MIEGDNRTVTGVSFRRIKAVVVDYGLGNLFSLAQACQHARMDVLVTSQKTAILNADIVILPGVGAFGEAIATLRRLDLERVIHDVADSGKLLIGICLGIQLLMSESYEFGLHNGLGIVEGTAVRFKNPRRGGRALKVPQVQWNRLFRVDVGHTERDPWENTPLSGLVDGEFMYFVHSFFVCPSDPSVILSTSQYGQIEFCSSLQRGNVFACQFHPERSGRRGLLMFENFVSLARQRTGKGRFEYA